VLKQSEENRYWDMGMEGVQEQEMKVSRRIEGLARLILMQRVSVSTDRYVTSCGLHDSFISKRSDHRHDS